MQQFNQLGKEWAVYTQNDTMRSGAQNPALFESLRSQNRDIRRILEIGCGEGRLARLLEAEFGADIVAFDSAENSISIAQSLNTEHHQNIAYSTSSASDFRSGKEEFDAAVSVMVIPYAQTPEELHEFFACAKYHLKPDARFTSVIFRTEFSNFDTQINNRIFSQTDTGGMTVTFLRDDGERAFPATVQRRFSKEEYEEAARSAGFKHVTWHAVLPEANAAGVWEEYKKDPPYELLEVW